MYFKFIDNAGVRLYRCRDPFVSPLWILLDKYYDQFETEYAERYEKVYGFQCRIVSLFCINGSQLVFFYDITHY